MTMRTSALILGVTLSAGAIAQSVFIPESSRPSYGGVGAGWAHTNHLILEGAPSWPGAIYHGPRATPNPPGYGPIQIRTAYHLKATGGSGAIAIVLAYRYPSALPDFNTFASQFGLPVETSPTAGSSKNKVFQVVYATGHQPKTDVGWSQEGALDIEWSHAMAPSAKIYLVEAASNSTDDLFAAISVASQIKDVKEVSMSWGGSEFPGETGYDGVFTTPGIDYFAAAGDTAAEVSYPAASPNVIGVGGTSLQLTAAGTFSSEVAWSDSGGGLSVGESVPSYQASLGLRGRGTPDIALDADPNTGVAVYDSTPADGYVGWLVFGGTSVGTPASAGIANLMGKSYSDSAAQLAAIYAKLGDATAYRDITKGHAGANLAKVGYDLVTGVGCPLGTGAF